MDLAIKFDSSPGNRLDINKINLIALKSGLNSLEINCEKYKLNYNISGLKNIKKLVIIGMFNGKIIKCENIEILKIISSNFNSDIECPPSLTELTIISDDYNNIPLNIHNTNIKLLTINSSNFNKYLGRLPMTLNNLVINTNKYDYEFDNLPTSLREFKLKIKDYDYQFNYLPDGLQKLTLHFDNTDYNKSLDNLPSSVLELVLINYYGDYNTIPDNVTKLEIEFANDFREYITHKIEEQIKKIRKLPANIKYLYYQKDIYKARVKSLLFQRNPEYDILKIISDNVNCSNLIINDGEYTHHLRS